MTTYLSIDVATKSLAIGIYRINPVGDLEQLAEGAIDSLIQPLALGVFDLCPGGSARSISTADKAAALKKILSAFDENIPSGEFRVLIEYQMNANHLSNAIFNMITYHYAGRAPIHTVYPSAKNAIHLHPQLKLSSFLADASSNYSANKAHCKFNFLYFMALFGHSSHLIGIRQKNLDDIADTFMQCLAFHKSFKP